MENAVLCAAGKVLVYVVKLGSQSDRRLFLIIRLEVPAFVLSDWVRAVVHLGQVLAVFAAYGVMVHWLERGAVVQGFLNLKRAAERLLLSVINAFCVRRQHVIILKLEVGVIAPGAIHHVRLLVAFEESVHSLLFLVEHRPVL